jgi:hypothetical protein
MLGKHYRSVSAPGSVSPGPSKRLKTAVSAVQDQPLTSSWSDYLSTKVKAVLPKFPLPGLSSFSVSVDLKDPGSLLCITPPGQSGGGRNNTSRVAPALKRQDQEHEYAVPSAKDYATPVSAKPSHTVNLNLDSATLSSELGSDDSSTLRSLSADTDSESPLDVFGLRKGPLLRTGRRSARDLVASKALMHLLAKEHVTAPQQNYMQLRQNGHLKPMRRLGM